MLIFNSVQNIKIIFMFLLLNRIKLRVRVFVVFGLCSFLYKSFIFTVCLFFICLPCLHMYRSFLAGFICLLYLFFQIFCCLLFSLFNTQFYFFSHVFVLSLAGEMLSCLSKIFDFSCDAVAESFINKEVKFLFEHTCQFMLASMHACVCSLCCYVVRRGCSWFHSQQVVCSFVHLKTLFRIGHINRMLNEMWEYILDAFIRYK